MTGTVTTSYHADLSLTATRPIHPVHLVAAAAEAVGWGARDAFEAAMYLVSHGVSVAEAAAAFEHCTRWRQ